MINFNFILEVIFNIMGMGLVLVGIAHLYYNYWLPDNL